MTRTTGPLGDFLSLKWLGLELGCMGFAFALISLCGLFFNWIDSVPYWIHIFHSLSAVHWCVQGASVYGVSLWALWLCGVLLPSPQWPWPEWLLRTGAAFFLSFFSLLLFSWLFAQVELPVWQWSFIFLSSFSMRLLMRMRSVQAGKWSTKKCRVLILGTGRRARVLQEYFKNNGSQSIDVMGYIHFPTEREVLREQVIHLRIPLEKFVQEQRIDEVVIALDDRRNALPIRQLLRLRQQGFQMTESDRFFEKTFGFVYLPWVDSSRFIFKSEYNLRTSRIWIKRFLDVAFSSLLLFVVSLPLGFFLLCSWFSDRPLFHLRAKILGQNKTTLELYHLNVTMLPAWMMRIFHPERWTYLWYVFKGKLSFIGPHWLNATQEKKEFEINSNDMFFELGSLSLKPGLFHYVRPVHQDSAVSENTPLGFDLYYLKQADLRLDWLMWSQLLLKQPILGRDLIGFQKT